MKQRVKEMEDEAAKLREMQAEVEKSMNPEEGELTYSNSRIEKEVKEARVLTKRWGTQKNR